MRSTESAGASAAEISRPPVRRALRLRARDIYHLSLPLNSQAKPRPATWLILRYHPSFSGSGFLRKLDTFLKHPWWTVNLAQADLGQLAQVGVGFTNAGPHAHLRMRNFPTSSRR